MKSPVQIRPIQDHDVTASLPLWQEVEPNITESDFRARLEGSHVSVAVDDTENVVGVARLSRRVTMPKTQYFLWIVVSEAMRRHGIGRQLYQHAVQMAQSEGVANLISRIPDENVAANAFSEELGFHVTRHMVNLVMSLADFDPAPVADKIEAVQQQGIRFVTYADFGDTVENQHRLHELNRTLSAQIPITERENFPSFDAYVEARIRPETVFHDGIFIAVDTHNDDMWIGMSGISIYRATDHAFNEMTGVLASYTGRGIAQALKLQSTLFAQAQGVSTVRTINDVGNAPMLAVNQKLGYVQQDGFYFVKRLL